jgi:hypothetical protein
MEERQKQIQEPGSTPAYQGAQVRGRMPFPNNSEPLPTKYVGSCPKRPRSRSH